MVENAPRDDGSVVVGFHLWHNWVWTRTHGAGAGDFLFAQCSRCPATKPVRWVRTTYMNKAQIAAVRRSKPPLSKNPPCSPRLSGGPS